MPTRPLGEDIVELRTEMKYLIEGMKQMRDDVNVLQLTLEEFKESRWIGKGILMALGGGGLYGIQKLSIILPAFMK